VYASDAKPTHSDAKAHAGLLEADASDVDASVMRRHMSPIRPGPAEKATEFSAIWPLDIA
jgi:hypothetical protein